MLFLQCNYISLLYFVMPKACYLQNVVFMPLLAPMFAGLVASSISMLSGENFQS